MANPPSLRPQYAGFFPRYFALFIDGIILIPLAAVNWISFNQVGAMAATTCLILFGPLYNILLLGWKGQTIGMMVAGIKAVRLDLQPLRWSNAFGRYLVNFLWALVTIYVQVCLMAQAGPEFFDKNLLHILVNLRKIDETYEVFDRVALWFNLGWTFSELLVLLLNEKKRAIHDFIGGTVVVVGDGKGDYLLDSQPRPPFIAAKVIGGLGLLGMILAAVWWGFYAWVFKAKLAKLLAPPAELQETGVRKGQGFVSIGTLLQEDRIGEAMDIIPNPASVGTYLAAGKEGVLVFKSNGETVKNSFFDFDPFNFKARVHQLRWAVEGSWVGLMNKGGWDRQVLVMDPEGKVLWTYDAPTGDDDMAVGNLDGDLKPKFILGMNGSGGLQALDDQGQLLWQIPEKNVWHVETADLNGDGKDVIIHSNAGGKILVRNGKGEVVKELHPPVYASDFSLVPWPGSERWVAAIPDKTKVLFFGLQQGAPVTEFDMGITIGMGKTKGVWVTWDPSMGQSLALLTDYSPVKASFLTLFDESGQIQYQEVFGEPCGALLAVNGATPGTQELWCGCDNRILRYQKAPATPSSP